MSKDKKTWKDIFSAAERGDLEAVKYFTEDQNISLTAVDSNNQTIAHIAAKHGRLEVLKYLLQKNPKLLTFTDVYNKSVLYRALQNGSLEIIVYLFEVYKLDIFERDPLLFGNTVVHFAAELGRIRILKYFFEEKHADVNMKNDIGETPIFSAAQAKRFNTIKYLIDEQNADPTIADSNGENILYISAWKNDLTLSKYLLDNKKLMIDVNWQNDLGDTVVNCATKLNYIEFVKYFVEEKKADVNIADNMKRTPLHVAARLGNFHLVSFFIENGADPELEDSKGNTPSDEAEDLRVVRYLDDAIRRRNRFRNRRSVRFQSFQVRTASGLLRKEIDTHSIRLPEISETHYAENVLRNITSQLDGLFTLTYLFVQFLQKDKNTRRRR